MQQHLNTIVSTVKSFDEQIIQETSVCNSCLFTFRSNPPLITGLKMLGKNLDWWLRFLILKLRKTGNVIGYVSWISKFKKSGTLLDIGAAYGTGWEVFSLVVMK